MTQPSDRPSLSGLRVLVVDDDEPIRRLVATLLSKQGVTVVEARDGNEALARAEGADVIVLDNMMPFRDGLSVLAHLPRPLVPVVFLTADPSVEHAVEALQGGAIDYLSKPLRVPSLLAAVERAVHLAQRRAPAEQVLPENTKDHEIVGNSVPIREALRLAGRAAATNVPVLLLGASGTGKELFARHIHDLSRRSTGPFVSVNCAALPKDLVESELFGHERGAFTGAVAKREGLFVAAEGGTLFFDEVGELEAPAQAKLLRALQFGEITPVGGRTRKVDVRIVAATHRSLRGLGPTGAFREDLYFRLAVFELDLPPLRDRLEDVPPLTERILSRFAASEGRAPWTVSREAAEALRRYDWPGNVRELANALMRAAILADDVILPEHLPASVRDGAVIGRPGTTTARTPVAAGDANAESTSSEVMALSDQERVSLERALRETGGNVTRAAALLGIGRATFYRKARRYDLPLRGADEGDDVPPENT